MVNHWINKKKKEEARQALQKWCNKKSYDNFGYYTTDTAEFFKMHPEYDKFKKSLRVNWNMFHINPVNPDATGIPEVTIQEDN